MKSTIVLTISLFLIACQAKPNHRLKEIDIVGTNELVLESNATVLKSKCPTSMVEIKGLFCPKVQQNCLEWMESPNQKFGNTRCARFEKPSKCLSNERKSLNFCIDKYEFPNKAGSIPEIGLSWLDMDKNCKKLGKRLCNDFEWTFACEGEDMLPYPYGYERDTSKCNIDKSPLRFDEHKFINPSTRIPEMLRINMSVPSGSMPECKSVFGVFDQTGNVDEATINTSGIGYPNALKGGWWSRVRNRCRPATTAHSTTFSYYQTSGRCCSELSN